MAIGIGIICGVIVFIITFIKTMPIILGIILAIVAFMIVNIINIIIKSVHLIGPNQVGLIIKRFSITGKKLIGDCPIAFKGEPGYQARLLMPGLRWVFWPVSRVEKQPWVQVPAGEIGVVIAQIGKPLPVGAKSA